MEYKERIHWLGRYQDCLHQQEMLRSRILAARDRATSLQQALSPIAVQSSHLGSSIEKAIETVESFQNRLAQMVVRNEQTLYEIESAIGALPCPESSILGMRYIDGKTFQEIADKMNLVPRRVYQIHQKGVLLLDTLEYMPDAPA